MGSDYVMWDSKITSNFELISAINGFRDSKKIEKVVKKDTQLKEEVKPKRMSKKEKKEKGDNYELFISKYYEEQGYTIAKHGLDNGVKDGGIDIIAKKGKEILFIQCKNWRASNKTRIRDKDLKSTQTDAGNYLKKNKLYNGLNYKMKILYVCNEDVYHASTRYYAKENSDIYGLEVIKIK